MEMSFKQRLLSTVTSINLPQAAQSTRPKGEPIQTKPDGEIKMSKDKMVRMTCGETSICLYFDDLNMIPRGPYQLELISLDKTNLSGKWRLIRSNGAGASLRPLGNGKGQIQFQHQVYGDPDVRFSGKVVTIDNDCNITLMKDAPSYSKRRSSNVPRKRNFPPQIPVKELPQEDELGKVVRWLNDYKRSHPAIEFKISSEGTLQVGVIYE